MKTKTCPGCQKAIGWTAKTCECGQVFGKAAGKADEPAKTRKAKGKPKAARKPAVSRPRNAGAAAPARCCLFNDGGVGIVAAHGTLELSPDDATILAGFIIQHFST